MIGYNFFELGLEHANFCIKKVFHIRGEELFG